MPESEDFSAALLEAFGRGLNAQAAVADEVADAVARAHAAASLRWPSLHVPPLDFGQALAAAVGDELSAETITSLHAADLWLASACALGQRLALEAADELLRSLRPTVVRVGVTPSAIDDLLQQVRTRLFTSEPDRPPRIRSYRGRGDLRSWLKVVVVRDAVRAARRQSKPELPGDEVDVLMDPGDDPELAAMKGSYHKAFRAAFAEALKTLAPRDRNVLRYHLVEGLGIDDLGAIYRVHRSTAARWLVRIRERLYAETRRELMRHLALTRAELDSVLRLIHSRLEASVAVGL